MQDWQWGNRIMKNRVYFRSALLIPRQSFVQGEKQDAILKIVFHETLVGIKKKKFTSPCFGRGNWQMSCHHLDEPAQNGCQHIVFKMNPTSQKHVHLQIWVSLRFWAVGNFIHHHLSGTQTSMWWLNIKPHRIWAVISRLDLSPNWQPATVGKIKGER